MTTKKELQRRLNTITEMIEERFRHRTDMLASTMNLLINLREVAQGKELKQKPQKVKKAEELAASTTDRVIISCDASIKENPGGPSSVGFVIRKGNDKPISMSKNSPATTNNQAEYDAIYEGLTTFFHLNNNPLCAVEVRSDSQLVVNQLNGEMKCQDASLTRRRDTILEFVRVLPVPVVIKWLPRNSTPDLQQANYLAQDLLGVSRH